MTGIRQLLPTLFTGCGDLSSGNLGEFLRQCIRHRSQISKGHERIAEGDLTAGNFLHVILDILGIRSNDGAVVMVVRIFEFIALIEQRRIEDELNTLTDQPGHITVRQLCRVTLGFTGDGLNTELVDLTIGAGREHHAVAQFGEKCEPERIVLVHIQYSGDTYHTSGSLVGIQGFIGE